jgi:hypothetical protein
MEGAYYDAGTGCVVFETDHFSLFAVAYESWNNPFADVAKGDWYYSAVKYANKNGLFAGTTNTTFGPNMAMTRAMLVTVLYRLKVSRLSAEQTPFQMLKTSGMRMPSSGRATTTSFPATEAVCSDERHVTREQMAVILYNYASYKG